MSSARKKGARKDDAPQGENVRVVVRVRPLSHSEAQVGDEEVMRIGADKTTIQVLLPSDEDFAGNTRHSVKKFALDGCLDQSTTQQQVFNSSGVKSLLNSALEGFSATVFAYGQTGSGKTYTMAGAHDGDMSRGASSADGVIPRSVRYIFEQVDARQETMKYTIRASFLEIVSCARHC
jgi:predicted ATPase